MNDLISLYTFLRITKSVSHCSTKYEYIVGDITYQNINDLRLDYDIEKIDIQYNWLDIIKCMIHDKNKVTIILYKTELNKVKRGINND